MRKLKDLKNLFGLLFCCAASVFFVSCDNDDKPTAQYELTGTYTGKLLMGKTDAGSVEVKVEAKSITIAKFPLKDIVTAIVDKVDQDEALKSLADKSYAIEYQATKDKKGQTLVLSPKKLDFEITVKGKKQTVEVNFASKASGTYTSSNQTLTFTLKAESVNVDGKKVDSFTATDITLSQAKKNSTSAQEDLTGTYTGKMKVGNADAGDVEVKVEAKIITVAKFPLKDIVTAIVDKADQDEALKSLADKSYAIDYQSTKDKNGLTLTLSPKKLEFEVTVKGKKQKVELGFASKASGTYNSTDKTLSFSLKAESASIDGKKVDSFAATDFALSGAKKKK